MTHVARLIVRLTVGGLLAGHGAQKLFGWFGGHGLEGTTQWIDSMHLRPPRFWAQAAGTSEFAGGLLTMLGFLNPVGPLMVMGSMLMAWVKVHVGKPIWVSAGGAELPLTNIAAAFALMLVGPGRISIDSILGIRLPRWFGLAGLLGVVGSVAWAEAQSRAVANEGASVAGGPEQTEAGMELQSGGNETMEPAMTGQSSGAMSAGSSGGEIQADAAEENFETAAAAMRTSTDEEPTGA